MSSRWDHATRPEVVAAGDAAAHYEIKEAARYTVAAAGVQRDLAVRALQLAGVRPGDCAVVVDIGVGSGLCARHLSRARGVGAWAGTDVSAAMLALAAADPSCAGRVCAADMAQGLPARRGAADAAVSVSAVQWLCAAARPAAAAARLMAGLAAALRPGGLAALQVYVECDAQAAALVAAASASGLQAGFFADLPHASPAKKFFVCCRKPDLSPGAAGAGGLVLGRRACPLAWPSGASCCLEWAAHVAAARAGGGGGGGGGMLAVTARLMGAHARAGRKALRLFRSSAAAAAAAAASSSAAGEDGTAPARPGDLVVVEAEVAHRGLLPCGGAVVVHLLLPCAAAAGDDSAAAAVGAALGGGADVLDCTVHAASEELGRHCRRYQEGDCPPWARGGAGGTRDEGEEAPVQGRRAAYASLAALPVARPAAAAGLVAAGVLRGHKMAAHLVVEARHGALPAAGAGAGGALRAALAEAVARAWVPRVAAAAAALDAPLVAAEVRALGGRLSSVWLLALRAGARGGGGGSDCAVACAAACAAHF